MNVDLQVGYYPKIMTGFLILLFFFIYSYCFFNFSINDFRERIVTPGFSTSEDFGILESTIELI